LRKNALPDRCRAKSTDEVAAEADRTRLEEWSFNPSPTPLVEPLGLAAALLLIAIIMAITISVAMI
jgi:hypothetical protein